MPSYGSTASPSIRKMESGFGSNQRKFEIGRIIGDPFALATISIGIVRSLECASRCYIVVQSRGVTR